MLTPTLTKFIFAIILAAVLSFNCVPALAQAPTPTPIFTPTPIPQSGPPLPGDTTILIVGAAILVLIVLGGVLKQSRLRK